MGKDNYFTSHFINRMENISTEICEKKYWIEKSVFNNLFINSMSEAYNEKVKLLRSAKIGKENLKDRIQK